MNAKITTQMEIKFWDLVINLLSESEWIRGVVRNTARLLPGNQLVQAAKIGLMAALFGLVSGMILFTLFMTRI
jgi:hypothetical protein